MFANTRFYAAIVALATMEAAVKVRFVKAMQILKPVREIEFESNPDVKNRLIKLRQETSYKGAYSNGTMFLDEYENTAQGRKNATYAKYAEELFSIWVALNMQEN